MQPVIKLRMVLTPLDKEHEQAYYKALSALAEIIRKELERTALDGCTVRSQMDGGVDGTPE